jgi:hypothetical protein
MRERVYARALIRTSDGNFRVSGHGMPDGAHAVRGGELLARVKMGRDVACNPLADGPTEDSEAPAMNGSQMWTQCPSARRSSGITCSRRMDGGGSGASPPGSRAAVGYVSVRCERAEIRLVRSSSAAPYPAARPLPPNPTPLAQNADSNESIHPRFPLCRTSAEPTGPTSAFDSRGRARVRPVTRLRVACVPAHLLHESPDARVRKPSD